MARASDPERVVSTRSATSEFVVVVVVTIVPVPVFQRRENRSLRQNRSLPKVSPGGLACRNAMWTGHYRDAVSPAGGVISSRKSTTSRGGDGEARREPHSCYSTITPRVISPVSPSRRVARSRPHRKIISCHFRHRPIYKRAQSIRARCFEDTGFSSVKWFI